MFVYFKFFYLCALFSTDFQPVSLFPNGQYKKTAVTINVSDSRDKSSKLKCVVQRSAGSRPPTQGRTARAMDAASRQLWGRPAVPRVASRGTFSPLSGLMSA